ncbi:MAG: 50S ribosomal protein L21 [Candidatus Bipolaricaulia bacterium]
MYAIIETGGKQYRVQEGDFLVTEKIADRQVGEAIEFDRVLLIADDEKRKIGRPYISGAKVIGQIVENGLGKKVIIFKYKRKKRYRRKRGHRQPYIRVSIEKIQTGRIRWSK